MTIRPVMYPLKQNDLCEYNHRFIMSISLVFDEIIMNIIRNKKLERHNEENDCLFTKIENSIIYMYRGSIQYFKLEKGTYECLEVP